MLRYGGDAAAHITVEASSGDTGATGNKQAFPAPYYTHPVAFWPASDPDVTGVGGTSLNLGADGGRRSPDTVWNDTYSVAVNQYVNQASGPSPLASGGGMSVIFPRPSYQDGVEAEVGAWRGIPDISMSGSCSGMVEIYHSFNGQAEGFPPGWNLACGTSESAPLFAGIVALAVQVAGHSLGLINPAIYQLAAEHAPGIVLVTSGNNTVTFTQNTATGTGGKTYTVHGYSVGYGYSLATGVGTVEAGYFVPELARLG